MKLLVFFLAFFIFCNGLHAQYLEKKIINTSGNIYTGENFSLKTSVGEPVVGIINTNSITNLSQGFLGGIKVNVEDSSSSPVYSFAIYPNPTMNYIVIEGDLTLIKQVNIYDIYGNLVSAQSVQNGTAQINSLEKGFYIVQLIGYSNGILSQFKIVKL